MTGPTIIHGPNSIPASAAIAAALLLAQLAGCSGAGPAGPDAHGQTVPVTKPLHEDTRMSPGS